MAFGEKFVRRPQTVWLRKALFQIHLWTGIAVGLYVIAISVSGSALFFRNAVLAMAPGRKIVAGSGPLLTKDQLMQAALRVYPDYEIARVTMGRDPGQEVEIWLDRGSTRKQRIFDPYTGRDLGNSVPYSLRAISWMLELHVNLLAGKNGRIANGIGAILLTLLCITGAVIWWPGIANWRRSLAINPKANWKRLNWELHSVIGFWTFAFLFMWSFTGVYLVFQSPFESFINRFAPLDYYRPLSLNSNPLPTSLPAWTQQSDVKFVPVADQAPPPKTKGRGKRPRFIPHYSKGDQVIRAFFALHFGNFAGMRTRILWALLGLTPALLFITGAIMWWNRVLSREARKLRTAENPLFRTATASRQT